MPFHVMILGWGLVPGPGMGWTDLACLPGALGLVPSLKTCLSSLSMSEFKANTVTGVAVGFFWGSVFLQGCTPSQSTQIWAVPGHPQSHTALQACSLFPSPAQTL